jgi:hypothetical protein
VSDEDNPYIVRLTRRTLPEQVDYLILQVSFLIARVGTLERQVEDLNARLKVVERATPWQDPKKTPPRRPIF